MAGIRLRSPRYRSSICSSAHLSVQMTITISGVLRYTIIKDSIINIKNLFEYAELCRDYINISWTGSYSGYSPQAGLTILTEIKYFSGANGTGTLVTTGITGGGQVTQYGFDSYSNFVEGYNFDLKNSDTLISNYTETSGGTKTYTGNGQLVNINRFGCNKFDVVYIDFVNKYGAIQREYFTLKNVEKIKAKREDFKSNIMDIGTGEYSINKHTIQNFNIVANEEMTVNSDYLPEYYNEVFTELLLSDQVWAYIKPFSTNSFTAIPINITNSDLTYKTQVNDRLINFSFSFKMSYDYINNIR